MNPSFRVLFIVLAGALAAIIMGAGIANEHFLLSAVVVGVLVWAMIEWSRGPFPEVWVLAVVLAGYIVGNRGFAQLSLTSDLPLLPAETALLVAIPALVLRLARKQLVAVRREWLNLSLLAWILVGAFRLPVDLRAHGFLALRDFAMVYYAVFFFIAQAYAGHAASVHLLRRALTAAFLALPVVAIVDTAAPDLLLHITLRGIPLIFYKSDLLAALLMAGFFWLWTRWEKSRHAWWLIPAAACLLLPSTAASPRAAIVALVVVTLMWLAARRWRIAAAQVAIVGVAVTVAVFIFVLGNKNLRETAAYSTYEHVISIADIQGTGTYTNHESGDPGDNNRFRVVWWTAVVDETLADNPLFGLGFGHDLAARFLADYGLVADDDFSARSPHSMLMSVLGRMGLLGLLLWLAVTAGMVALTRRIFRQGAWDNLGLVSVAWVLWISGCFGIVLEGPMGAVVFWTVLGLANAGSAAEEVPETADEPVLAAPADLHRAGPADEVAASP
jgi:hypothetical protein